MAGGLADSLRQRAYGVGNWFRREVNDPLRSVQESVTDWSPMGLMNEGAKFGESISDAIGQGYDAGAPAPQSTIGADGVPSLLRRPEPLAIEQALAGTYGAELAAPPVAPEPEVAPATIEQSIAASQPTSHIRYSIGGGEWQDYGANDSAPSLYNRDAGPVRARAFGREYSPTGGSFSQMNPIDQGMKSLPQLQDEQAIADAQPVPDAPFQGATVGSMRAIEQEIAKKAAAERAKIGGELAVEQGKSTIRQGEAASLFDKLSGVDAEVSQKVGELRAHPRYATMTPEQRQQAEALLMEQLNPSRRRENIAIAAGRGNVQVRPGDLTAGFGAQ